MPERVSRTMNERVVGATGHEEDSETPPFGVSANRFMQRCVLIPRSA